MEIESLRVLFIHSGSDLYGASRSLLRLSARLARDGAVVQVVLPHEGPLVPALQRNGVSVLIRRNLAVLDRQKVKSPRGLLTLLARSFLSIFELRRVIAQSKPQLVHTMTAVILTSGLASRLAGVPHIWHIRESFGEFGRMWHLYQRYIAWLSTRIVCVSAAVAEQFAPGSARDKICVIHNGFPADEFPPVRADRIDRFRETYGIASDTQLVGVVGRIKFQRKGQEVFVAAAGLLRQRFPHVRFLCIGSPFPGNEEHLARLTRLIRESGLEDYVLYTGDVEDIKAALAALEILVLPSVQPEPFGGVVIEAMAMSRPVVATSVGGSVEQVLDGVTGFLVPPGDPVALADRIERLLESEDRRREFGQEGRKRYLDKFEFEAFYRKMLDLYAEGLRIASDRPRREYSDRSYSG